MPSLHFSRRLAVVVATAAFTFAVPSSARRAHATLTASNPNGVPVVHSSFTNITWLQEGNLLGRWIAERGVEAVFNDIKAAVPTVTLTYDFSGPRVHNLVREDYDGWWGANGGTTFYGAYAFVEYLNATAYGGTNQWRLPDAINTVYANPFPSGFVKSGDFGQLYYDELGSAAGAGMSDPLNHFAGEVHAQYWSWTYFDTTNIVQPFGFNVGRGDQYFLDPAFPYYVWPVTNGTLAAVPEANGWLLTATVATSTALLITSRRLMRP